MSIISHLVGHLGYQHDLESGETNKNVTSIGRVTKLSTGEISKGFEKRISTRPAWLSSDTQIPLPKEGGLNLPCGILMGRTWLSHKSNSQITFHLQFLAMLNGLCVPFAGTLSLNNLDSSFG